jgi:ATP-dependent helicase/nuclease subunit A
MKDRLKIQLTNAYKESHDDQLKAFIKEQLSLIDTAMISTIHSFALSLIKDLSYVLNLDPEMSRNVLDDGTSQRLFDECSDIVIHNAILQHPQAFQSTQSLISTSSFDFTEFKRIIQEIYKVRRLQLQPEAFDEKTLQLHSDPLSIIEPILCESLTNQLNEAIEWCNQVLVLGSTTDTPMDSVRELYSSLQSLHSMLSQGQFQNVIKYLHRPSWVRGIPRINHHESYKEAKSALQKSIQNLVQSYNDIQDHVHDVLSLLPHIELLIWCVKELTDLMQEKKQALKVIEFDDMERLAYLILTHPDYDIPAFYQSRFSDILVDEFQDTNDVQNEIITLISNGKNVFRVGDVKQSIYRFRGAKPQLMRSMIKNETSSNFTLPHNFRSSEPIVKFNNLLFNILMNVEGFSDVYLEDDHVSVGKEAQKQIITPVTYIKVNKAIQEEEDASFDSESEEIDEDEDTSENSEEFKTKSYENAADHIKARFITKDIIDRHQNLNVPFKDICVLVKSHAQKETLKKLFEEKGIPHFINSPQGFLKHPSITQLLMLATYCLFPSEFYLSGVLLSQFTMLTTEDVAKLKLHNGLPHDLASFYPELASSLEHLRNSVCASSLPQAIHECAKFNDFYHRNDSQGKLNIDALIQKAVDFESSHQGGLAAFIQSLEHLKEAKIAEAMDVALSDDVVKVMTIHASKGLQFPLVYVFNDESTSVHASRDQVIVNPDYGFTLRIKQDYGIEVKNIVREALLYCEKKAAYEESLRLWYVALTRAEKEMVCIGINKETKTYSTKLHASTVLKSKGINGLLLGLQTFFQKSLLSTHEIEDPNRAAIVSLKLKEVEDIKALPLLQVTKQASIPLTPLDTSNRLKPKEVGSLIHSILERCVLSNNPIQDIQSMSLDLSTAQKEGMISFFTHPLTQHWNEFQKQSEFPIITKNETGYHQYYLDLLMKKDDEWIIVDFKTDKVTHVEQLKERYASQLLSYDQALRSYAPSLKTYIYSIVLKEAILINE